MKTGTQGIELIKLFEGFRSAPYLCPAGIPTIGYGSTRYPDGRKVAMTDQPITQQQATQMLADTLGQYEAAVNASVHVPLRQSQFDALVSFAYNLGVGNLRSSTLVKRINSGDLSAGDEFLKWNKAGGRVLDGLTRRRAAERDLFNA